MSLEGNNLENYKINLRLDSSTKMIGANLKKNVKETKDIRKELAGKDNQCKLEISNAARKRYAKNTNSVDKKCGTSSAREIWEDDLFKEKHNRFFHEDGTLDTFELFREDDPDAYCQYVEYLKSFEQVVLDEGLEKAIEKKYNPQLAKLAIDWTRDKLTQNPDFFSRPSLAKDKVIDYLDVCFSNANHNVSFDVFSPNHDNVYDIWRFSAKFNIQLTEGLYDKLISGTAKEQSHVIDVISKKVDEIKNAELLYEGNKTALRFGIKIYDDFSATYHAKYGGGSYKMNNFTSNSIEELLKQIMD